MILATTLFVGGLIVAPFTCLIVDMINCFLPWARASHGNLPWEIYAVRTDCNYPPLWLYLLTAIERLRLMLHASPEGGLAFTLMKLPGLLSIVALMAGCQRYLRPMFGESAARNAAIACGLCVGLWVDAAIWGQTDALLCLFLAGAAWALMRERPTVAGILVGLALAYKLQAIVAVPFLLMYAFRRSGPQRTIVPRSRVSRHRHGISAVLLLRCGPWHGLVQSYTGAVGMYQMRSTEAYNMWHLSIAIRPHGAPSARGDRERRQYPLLGKITAKQIGLTSFTLAYAPLLWLVWRRPTPRILLLSVAAGYVTFFMLCTEMHERYLLPGIIFLAMAYGVSPTARRFYPVWNITSGINITMALIYFNRVELNTIDQKSHLQYLVLFRGGSVLLSSCADRAAGLVSRLRYIEKPDANDIRRAIAPDIHPPYNPPCFRYERLLGRDRNRRR